MKDDAIIEEMRRSGRAGTASAVAQDLARLAPGGLTQGILVSYFKRAFPVIPLRCLLEAGAWRRVSGGGLSDEGLDALLRPWLPTSAVRDHT